VLRTLHFGAVRTQVPSAAIAPCVRVENDVYLTTKLAKNHCVDQNAGELNRTEVILNTSSHPFRVGEEYGNRVGKYRVVSIDAPAITIQYSDGKVLQGDIDTLSRIWENMQAETTPDQLLANAKAAARTPRPASARRGTRSTD
jgi:hypothetical protein